MKCPVCNVETRIGNSSNVIKGNRLFRKREFICVNIGCRKYGEVVKTDYYELEATVEEENEEDEEES